MRDIWIISDTHFGHENIIKYCNRPFKDTQEMDEHMIEQWNKVVKPGDKIYHLGDVFFGEENASKIFPRLNGQKRLILGNHDNGKNKLLQSIFNKIEVWRMFPEFGLLLTHIPVHSSTLRVFVDESPNHTEGDCGSVKKQFKNVHGHIHQNPSPEGPYQCVCVEQINYTPVNIEELRIR